MTTLLAFAFVLGVLVFVHELGHFLAAKRVGIRVLKFQLGFNPTVVSFRRGDTEYGIGALPLGGYVKMAGDSPEDEAREGERAPDEFLAKSKWQRFQVLIMGPTMNILLAVVLTTVVIYQGYEIPAFQDQPVVVGAVVPNSPAASVDIRPGDRIVAVSGSDVSTWEDFVLTISTRPNRELALEVIRDGKSVIKRVTPVPPPNRSRVDLVDLGVRPDVHPHVPSLVNGDPAERAGVKVGDVIVAVNGQPVTFSSDLKDAIAKHPDQKIALSILRDGKPLTVDVQTGRHGDNGLIGIGILDAIKVVKPSGPADAMKRSLERNVQYAGLIFQTVWGLITRETSPKQLMGPVAIAQMSGESAQLGWIALFSLMASLSLNLGILNLLPIPVLDGGHIFIMALEGLARRDFSVRVKEKMLLAGFVALMMLMAAVIYNDLTRITWIERLMPWR